MQPTKKEAATLLAALRYWQANFDDEVVECFTNYFQNTSPLNDEEIDNLCDKINCSPAGYVVLNLSKPMLAGDGKYNFYVVGDEATSQGKLEHAITQVAERFYEDGHTWDSIGIYALLPVAPEETDTLVAQALTELEAEL